MNPHDRTRLRRNPPNVSVPQGFVDLYFNEEGVLIKESPGGVKTPVGGGDVTSGPVSVTNGTSAIADGAITGDMLADPLEVESISLANASSVALAGGITGGTGGLIYQHNGTDLGGVPYAPQPRNTVRKNVNIPAGRLNSEVINTNPQGQITATGNLATTFTSAATGALSIPVAVTVGDSVYTWSRKVVAAWNANATFATHYTAFPAGPYLQVQDKTSNRVDATLAFTISNDTATGITNKTGSKSAQFAFIELCEFTILASEAVQGSKYLFSGRITGNVSTTASTTCRLWLQVAEQASVTTGAPGFSLLLTKSAAGYFFSLIDFSTPCVLKASSANYILSNLSSDTAPGFVTEIVQNAGAVGSYSALAFAGTTGNPTGVTGQIGRPMIVLILPIQLAETTTAVFSLNLALTSGGW